MLQATFQLITLMEIREENGLLDYLIYPHSVIFSYIFQSNFKFKNNPWELLCSLERLLYHQVAQKRDRILKKKDC